MSDTESRLAAILVDRYTVDREIGRGGMATVFLARDLKHDRQVAIKVLHREVAAMLGSERFLGEIRTTAQLHHPHILPLFDSGESEGIVYFVTPYVEGENLRDRITREGQLGLTESVRLTTEVADALAHAHKHGVIHRDIKPENILVQDGHALVADFGIAIAVSHAAEDRITQTGFSLGTPHYMSPEQTAAERNVDGKTDQYSLAVVLYEMLTGEPPFTGPSAGAIMTRMMAESVPSLMRRRPSAPQSIADAVHRALEKVPGDRFPDITSFADALRGPGSLRLTDSFRNEMKHVDRRRYVPYAAVVLLGIAGIWWLAAMRAPRVDATLLRVPMLLSDTIGTLYGGPIMLAVAPEGDRLAIAANSGPIKLVGLDDPVSRPIAGTDGGRDPAFSADGRELAFTRGPVLFRVRLDGGAPIVVSDTGRHPVWSDRGTLFFRRRNEFWSSGSGPTRATLLSTIDSATSSHIVNISPLPGDRYVLADWRGSSKAKALVVLDLQTGQIDSLGISGYDPHYSSTGHVIFADSAGTITAVPFSARKRRVTGLAVTIGPRAVPNGLGSAQFAISQNGVLIELPDEGAKRMQLMIVSSNGDVRPASREIRSYSWFSPAPDGRHLALEVSAGAAGPWATWVVDLESGVLSRVNSDGTGSRPQGWSADSRRIYYLSEKSIAVVMSQPWDGSAAPVEALKLPAGIIQGSIDRSGRMYVSHSGTTITLASLDSSAAPRVLVNDATTGPSPQISPDGHLVTYTSTESGRSEVYVRDVSPGGGRIRVSLNGGVEPLWNHDGSIVFYRDEKTVRRADIQRSPLLSVTRRDSLFTSSVLSGPSASLTWAVLPDGQHFVMLRDLTPVAHPLLVAGWTRLLH